VFWWFTRGDQFVRCESRLADDGACELRFMDAAGIEHIERFESERELSDRQRELERALAEDGWTGPHGWLL
jgi:hypothetical protein